MLRGLEVKARESKGVVGLAFCARAAARLRLATEAQGVGVGGTLLLPELH